MRKNKQKWYIPVNENNFAELEAWWKQHTQYTDWPKLPYSSLLLSEHPNDDSYFWGGSEESLNTDHPSYQKITLEEFRIIINSLPEHWYIAVTDENIEELNSWRLSKRTVDAERWDSKFIPGASLLSSHPADDGSYFWLKDAKWTIEYKHPEYKLITLEQFRQITTNQTQNSMNTLPIDWYIEVTEENKEELSRWRSDQCTSFRDYKLRAGQTLLSKHKLDSTYYYCGNAEQVRNNAHYNDYQEITLEQFRQITNPTQKPMTKSIQITHSLLIEYYKAATTHQKEYLNIHFKLDGTTTDEAIRGLYDLACWDWKPRIKKNHPDCFPEDSKHFDFSKYVNKHGCDGIVSSNVADSLGLCKNFIQVRGSSTKTNLRAFYLTSEYNWELIKEGGATVLIPTKM
jgi:hypothetical protein